MISVHDLYIHWLYRFRPSPRFRAKPVCCCHTCCTGSTGCQRYIGTPLHIAKKIKETIKYELGLTVSIGVSFNKIFAKLGSDMKKPDAVTVIPKESFKEIVWELPASDMLGIGRATEKKLSSVGIYTIGQIAQFPVDFFQRRLGKCGVDIK